MTDQAAIYLLEAYRSSALDASGLADRLRSALAGSDGVRVLGLLEVPVDEAVLCLVAAESAAGTTAIRELVRAYGSNARLLEVRWDPGGGS